MNDTKSADAPPFDNPVIKDEPIGGTTSTDEGLKDDNQISAGNTEADKLKSISDSIHISPKTMALSGGKSPEADTAFDGEECASKTAGNEQGCKVREDHGNLVVKGRLKKTNFA